MLSLGAGARRVYLAVGATDLRKGFDGLYGLVRSRLEEDPMSGQLFVFCNAGRTLAFLFHWTYLRAYDGQKGGTQRVKDWPLPHYWRGFTELR